MNLGHAADLRHNYDPAAMEARAHQVLDAAWAAGIRYFDAARSYGKAEAFLATWLKSRRLTPESAVIGSKWGYTYSAGWRVDAEKHEVKEHSISKLEHQWCETRTLLGEHLDLYQIHSATLESGVLGDEEVLDELARLKEIGIAIGLTVTGSKQPDVIRKALAVRRGNDRLFDTVQATWNLLEPSAGPALQEAHDAGLGVIIKEALANGRLTERNADPAFATKRRRLENEAAARKCNLDALGLAAALAQPWADVVLSGAATVEHLRSNLAALTVDAKDLAQTLSDLAELPEQYWKQRSGLKWN